jgi:Gas vesicle synthesis protein GvpO
MADKTKQARARRSEARGRRRASVEEPFEELDQMAQEQAEKSPNSDLAGAAAKVVGTAAAAALLGALGGAAKALIERREPQTSEEPENRGDGEARPEAGAAAEPAPEQNEHDEQDQRDEEPQAAAPDDDSPAAEAAEPQAPEPAEEERKAPINAEGVSADEGAQIVQQARQQLEALLGTEAERVSGLERADGGWSVSLEVVEVSRIPESTDVLATYELILDDDRNLVSAARKRRYRRSQVDEAS